MKILKLFLILSLSCINLFGQVLNKYGNPLLRNYTPEEYNAEVQNWSAIQDDRGVMYFGNQDKGILEYDGNTWRKIAIPNNSMVHSLAKDNDGIIYVGAVGEFGYLEPNEQGVMRYVSLHKFNKDSVKIAAVYKTYFHNNKIYFCTPKYIVIYDKISLKLIDIDKQSKLSNLFSFSINNQLYISSFVKGLREIGNDSIVEAPNGIFFKNKTIYFMLPTENEQILVGTDIGFFLYNSKTGNTTPFVDKLGLISKNLENGIAYHALVHPNNNFGFAFPYSTDYSYLAVDSKGNPYEAINTSLGLRNGSVSHVYRNSKNCSEQPLWLTHFDGITRAEIHSSLHRYSDESGIEESIMDIIRFNGTLYLATLNGLYKQVEQNGFYRFIHDPMITSNTWSFKIYNNPETGKKSLLIAASSGIYEINEKGTLRSISDKFIDKINIVGYCLCQSKIDPSVLYVGEQAGLSGIKYANGQWNLLRSERLNKKTIKCNIRSIEEDVNGDLWLGSYVDGVIQYSPKTDSVKFYGTESGLPNLKEIQILNYNNELLFLTAKGIYKFDAKQSKFISTGIPNNPSRLIDYGVNKVVKTSNGFIVSCFNSTSNWVELVENNNKGEVTINSTPFKRLPDKFSDAVFVDDDGIIWISKAKELFSYNPNISRNYKQSFNTLIRKVTSRDTILFDGTYRIKTKEDHYTSTTTQQSEQIYRLPYRFNRLVFEFSACYYEKEEENRYSYFLEGSDEGWSSWNRKPEATYTNLREGSYIFKVKARNIYETESSIAEYRFSIAPPWYRTIIAYILYGILFIVFVWFLVRWNTRRLIEEKERLEQIVKERTAEVVRQKDEIEVQKEKISIQNEEIKSSIQYASRIQNAILTPKEQIEQIFNEYFILYLPRDIVSGDFYWIYKVGGKKICVVADCTGHGVPGGFMSMLGMSFISQIISKGGSLHPGDILNQLRISVINSLHQTGEVGGSKDGMDIAIYVIDEETNKLEFSGANNPLIHIRGNELNHIKSDKMPIGIHIRADEPFTTHVVDIQPGDCLYTFSDGYADQFGGADQRKFMIKNLKDLLLEIHEKPMVEQREILHKTLVDWHGDSPRIDDVVVMGVRI